MLMQLVERHLIHKNHELWNICDELTFKAKNLYNCGIYEFRQSYFAHSRSTEEIKPDIKFWNQIDKEFRLNKQFDMIALPAKVSGNVLRKTGEVVRSYFALLKAYYDEKNTKVTVKPELPKYLHKTKGRYVVEFNRQTFAKKRGPNNELILCPKELNLVIPTKIENPKSVRIVHKNRQYFIEVIYDKAIKELKESKNYATIDLGVNNLVTVTFSTGAKPIIIKGSEIKSINQGYNKFISKEKSKLPKNIYTSKHIDRLWMNRYLKIQTHIHKITSYLSKKFDEMTISKVVVGKNDFWKQKSKMSKKNNQNFVQIPYNTLIEQLVYKCSFNGIEVITNEESYTSKASLIDMDKIPVYDEENNIKYKFSGRRIKRGLYRSKEDIVINADINGSYNIMRKALGDEVINLSKISLVPEVVREYMKLSISRLIEIYK